jgi:hypothetical protein
MELELANLRTVIGRRKTVTAEGKRAAGQFRIVDVETNI